MIRLANSDDLREAVRMGREASRAAELPFDVGSSTLWFDSAIASWNKLVLVSEHPKGLNGLFIGAMAPWLFDKGYLIAAELVWWVDRKFRGTGIARELIEYFVHWAQQSGADHIQVGVLVDLDGEERVSRLYQHLGFKPYDREFILRS